MTSTDSATADHPAVAKLRADGAAEPAIRAFARAVERVAAGDTGLLREDDIEPVAELPDAEHLPAPDPDAVTAALDQAVVVKLNGGLGTSMGLSGPKALLEVKEGRTFLDIIARQVLHARQATGARLPLVLMHSFATQEPSLAALAAHAGIADQDVRQDFLQGRVPKLRAEDLAPAEWPAAPALEWAPPGHGDLYASLLGSGMLAELLEAGYRYAFVSNADNLGAALDPALLTWFAAAGAPFLMEVADRSRADRKGGHLARRRDGGGLVLRELAQTADEDADAFQDVTRHRFFNTNSLWIDLRALEAALAAAGGALDLPLIVNRKTVDPKDGSSTPVVQLETAMGAAIDVWDGAQAIRVPRSRYAPVKTTNDLMAVRSDAFVLSEDSRVQLAAERGGRPPVVDLDSAHFKLVGDFDQRVPHPVSLVGCERLTVRGDVGFGRDVVVRGSVTVEHDDPGRRELADGTVLEG